MGSGEVADARQETARQRNDRNLGELIQELRVAALGVQVLFGFLLALPFSNRFGQLSGAQRDLYLTSVVLSAAATTLLIGPVAYHRLVFRRGMKEELVRFANLLALLGLTAVGGAVLAAVLLVTWDVAGAVAGGVITAVLGVVGGGLWLGVPLVSRRGTARLGWLRFAAGAWTTFYEEIVGAVLLLVAAGVLARSGGPGRPGPLRLGR